MGELRSAEWYDAAWKRKHKEVPPDPQQSSFLPLWKHAANMVPPEGVVADLGCGDGSFATVLLQQYEHLTYKGYDFSNVACNHARRRKIDRATFHHSDVVGWTRMVAADTYVATEFLEHIVPDVAVLRLIPHGRWVVGSVPKRDSAGHVRWFTDVADVVARYGPVVLVERLIVTDHHYVFAGRRR